MGLFGKRKTRATRRAEARAIKAKAKLEAKLSAKNEVRRFKAAHKAETRALREKLKSQRASDQAALKVTETNLKAVREGAGTQFDPEVVATLFRVADATLLDPCDEHRDDGKTRNERQDA